jgi:hypothetical protein
MHSGCCAKELQVHHGQENTQKAQLAGTDGIYYVFPYS